VADDTLLEFPCDLPIKIFGRNVQSFRDGALSVIHAHYAEQDRVAVSEQVSREGTFVSLTVTVRARSREQLDAVYRALTASGDVLLVL
jgi:putative lipoic acid-binding regulatory protein